MKKTLCIAAILLTTNAFADPEPDRVAAPKANEPRVEMSLGTSVHDLRSTTVAKTYESAWPFPTNPTIDVRVSFPSSFLASGVGVRTTWVMPQSLFHPSTVLVDAFYSFGFRPKRLHGITPTLTIDVGPSVASVGAMDLHSDQTSYDAHFDIGAVASVAWGVYFEGFLARMTGGYRAGVSTCGVCGVQWDGDAFASIEIGFALDVASLSRRQP
jgi:hypothetical protein